MVALDSSHATIRPSFFGADASDPATPEEANDNSLSLHGSALSDMVELRLALDLLSNSKEERFYGCRALSSMPRPSRPNCWLRDRSLRRLGR